MEPRPNGNRSGIKAISITFVIIQRQSQAAVKNPLYQGLQRSNMLSIPQIVHFRFFGIPSATPDYCDAAAHWPPWFTKHTKT